MPLEPRHARVALGFKQFEDLGDGLAIFFYRCGCAIWAKKVGRDWQRSPVYQLHEICSHHTEVLMCAALGIVRLRP